MSKSKHASSKRCDGMVLKVVVGVLLVVVCAVVCYTMIRMGAI